MNCNVCKCKTCKYNNGCEYPAYYNCGHYIPNKENNTKTNGDMIKALFPKALIYVKRREQMSDLFEIKRNPNIIEIPDNATNGDMIKKIFPNAEYLICEDVVNVTFCDTEANWFDKDWWNAPYKENKE